MIIQTVNSYSDGHESTYTYNVPDTDLPQRRGSAQPFDDWLEEIFGHLYRYTGDGHGRDSDLGWSYEITILEASDPELVGQHWENSGN
jgi:hypothetical protein